MNYNYSYNNGGNGNQNNGNQNNGNRNNGYRNNGYRNNGNQREAKKSGAKEVKGFTREGLDFFGVNAWFVRRDVGLVKISGFVNSKSVYYDHKSGSQSVSIMFEVFYRNMGVKVLELGFYNFNTGRVFLEKTGILISTKTRTKDGTLGWCGFYSKK